MRPEKSHSFELGFEQKLWEKVIKTEHTVVWTEMENLIDWVAVNPAQWWLGGQYQNVGKARSYGFEDVLEYRLLDKVRLAYTYTFLKTLDRDTEMSLNRRPRHKHQVSATITPTDKLIFDISCLYIGERKDALWLGQIILDDYFKVDISGRYKINEILSNLDDETRESLLVSLEDLCGCKNII